MGNAYGRTKRPEERPWTVHPVWRGIGCLLILLNLVISYSAAYVVVDAGVVALPAELFRLAAIPYTKINFLDFFLGQINQFFANINLQYAHLLLWAAFLFVGFGLITFVYALMYRMVGPKRYSAVDAPPFQTKRKKRY